MESYRAIHRKQLHNISMRYSGQFVVSVTYAILQQTHTITVMLRWLVQMTSECYSRHFKLWIKYDFGSIDTKWINKRNHQMKKCHCTIWIVDTPSTNRLHLCRRQQNECIDFMHKSTRTFRFQFSWQARVHLELYILSLLLLKLIPFKFSGRVSERRRREREEQFDFRGVNIDQKLTKPMRVTELIRVYSIPFNFSPMNYALQLQKLFEWFHFHFRRKSIRMGHRTPLSKTSGNV